MCRIVKCRKCGNATWAGCGQHVKQVMAIVPRADRCSCAASQSGGKGGVKDFFARLIGR